ncbi:MAG: SpoIID/LytB domain-containing protein [Terriglobales bacterium]
MVLEAGPRLIRSSGVSFAGRTNEPADFILAIPGKIKRRYHGILEIQPSAINLVAIVTLDLEIAVASVVAAETVPGTPLEALKAQALATRSYFIAGGGRHRYFDFCDTTHCQFLREAPPAGSDVANAVSSTRGLVLAYHFEPFAAMYTRSCGGRTRTPSEVSLSSAAYPYYSVDCKYCRSHPSHWTTRISSQDGALLRSSDESARLEIGRRLGWNAVPSNDFVVHKKGDYMLVRGTGQGHGVGLCQAGARAMAEEGANFREILSHYYPNANVVTWPGPLHSTSARN